MVEEEISPRGLIEKIYTKLGLSKDKMDLVLSYTPPLNKKCRPIVLKEDEDVVALLASMFDCSCKIPLGVTVEPTEVCAYEKSGQESSDDADGSHDGSHDGFRDNYLDVDYCDSEPTDVSSSRQKLPFFEMWNTQTMITEQVLLNPQKGIH